MRDSVAIVGVGTTAYRRDAGRTPIALAAEACVAALTDAGLSKSDVDGIGGGLNVLPHHMQETLGVPEIMWWASPPSPFSFQVIEAAAAVSAGLCTTAVVYQGRCTTPAKSRAAAGDPFRLRAQPARSATNPEFDSMSGAVAYAAWANRYLQEHGVGREAFGLIAINSRTNAMSNEHAILRSSITMEDYFAARLVCDPFGVFDMEMPVDAGDALVITTRERAEDLRRPPVLVHAATYGQIDRPREDQTLSLLRTGQTVAMESLRKRSDVSPTDSDVLFPYDGFSFLAVSWLENAGFCAPGDGFDFLTDSWDAREQRLRVGGSVLVNPHGGSLSEGGTQGAGHLREAVVQLRGQAGDRQAAGARSALVTTGGLFWNATALMLLAA